MSRKAIATLCALAGFLLFPTPAFAPTNSVPPLREWQARKISEDYARRQHRPLYVVADVDCAGVRCRVAGEEPGYLDVDAGPDLTMTVVERRRFQLWVKDPFTGAWGRWL